MLKTENYMALNGHIEICGAKTYTAIQSVIKVLHFLQVYQISYTMTLCSMKPR